MAKLHVEVTQEDITKGLRRSSEGCIVSRAIHRCSEGSLNAVVTSSVITLYVHPFRGPFADTNPSDVVSGLIRQFDIGAPVSPFAFDLELPDSLFAVPS